VKFCYHGLYAHYFITLLGIMTPPYTLLHLSLIPNIGPGTLKKLGEYVVNEGIDLYALTTADYMNLGIGEAVAQKLVEGLQDRIAFDKEVKLLESTGIAWTTFGQPDYPAMLWHTHFPPLVLYWQGTAVWDTGQALSVVGSREGTEYGRRAVETLVAPCVEKGFIIVSGGARGIDTMAHECALAYGGQTVAVLGSGLLKPYPASNKRLFLKIAQEGGAVVSGFPLLTEAIGWNFPERNRIIAGMTRGCLVVQGARKSGALITAKFALNEGRNVYAVPGPFDDPLSEGCHVLLQDGAQLVLTADDILQDYGLSVSPQEKASVQVQTELPLQKEIVFTKKTKKVYEGLEALCERPISVQELVDQTGKDENELKMELFDLQLAGKLQQDFAGLWSRS